LLSRQQQPHPRGDDRERITRARQAAEALFTSKPPATELLAPDSPTPGDHQSARKPRVLGIISPAAPVRHEVVEAAVSPEQPATRNIPRSQFARIRTLVKYGMKVAQVAEVYGAAVGEIEHIIRPA
jgi:hypothetical protein